VAPGIRATQLKRLIQAQRSDANPTESFLKRITPEVETSIEKVLKLYPVDSTDNNNNNDDETALLQWPAEWLTNGRSIASQISWIHRWAKTEPKGPAERQVHALPATIQEGDDDERESEEEDEIKGQEGLGGTGTPPDMFIQYFNLYRRRKRAKLLEKKKKNNKNKEEESTKEAFDTMFGGLS